jgi:hypothetical protein
VSATTQATSQEIHGVIAEFGSADELLRAATKIRDKGYVRWDVHSPFPIHGMDDAMGLKRSPLGWFVAAGGLVGTLGGIGLQMWTSAVAYPLITAGKEYGSWQAFVPVTFECGVLVASFAALLGMIWLNGLPRWYHPTLKHEPFQSCSDNRFFLVIEATDPMFDRNTTAENLREIGGREVTVLEA